MLMASAEARTVMAYSDSTFNLTGQQWSHFSTKSEIAL